MEAVLSARPSVYQAKATTLHLSNISAGLEWVFLP